MMHFQVLFLSIAGSLLALANVGLYSLIAVWAFWWIEGRGFTLMYHVILPDSPSVPQYSLWTWLRGWFTF